MSHQRAGAPMLLIWLGASFLVSCARSSPEPKVKREQPANPIRLTPTLPTTADSAPAATEDLTTLQDTNREESAAEKGLNIAMSDLLVDKQSDGSDEPDSEPANSALDDQIRQLLIEAQARLREQDLATAATLAWESWKQSPTNADQIAEITEILIRSNKQAAAIVVVERAIVDERASSKARILRAQAYLQLARNTDEVDASLSYYANSTNALLDLQRGRELRRYGRSGAMLLLEALSEHARLAAKHVRREECLEILEELFDLGFLQIPTFVGEPEFSTLLRDPVFERRVAEYREAIRERLNPEIERRMAATEAFQFEINLRDLAGRKVSLANFRGKVVVIDFWGTWCGPCRMGIPHLARLSQEYSDDLEVIGIAYEKALPARWPKIVSQFVQENEVPYTCVIGNNATRSQVPGFRSFPTILFLDRAGTVRLKLMGYHGFEQLDAIVNLLMMDNRRS